MDQQSPGVTRREALGRGVRSLAGVSVCALVLATDSSRAAKAAKQDFAYQDKPKAGKSCVTCRLFSPSTADVGVCAVLEGEVSPNGWCMAYSPRTP